MKRGRRFPSGKAGLICTRTGASGLSRTPAREALSPTPCHACSIMLENERQRNAISIMVPFITIFCRYLSQMAIKCEYHTWLGRCILQACGQVLCECRTVNGGAMNNHELSITCSYQHLSPVVFADHRIEVQFIPASCLHPVPAAQLTRDDMAMTAVLTPRYSPPR